MKPFAAYSEKFLTETPGRLRSSVSAMLSQVKADKMGRIKRWRTPRIRTPKRRVSQISGHPLYGNDQ